MHIRCHIPTSLQQHHAGLEMAVWSGMTKAPYSQGIVTLEAQTGRRTKPISWRGKCDTTCCCLDVRRR